MKTKPTHEIRLGTIKAVVWKNDTESRGPRFNVKLTRIYKEGDTWKSTESFGRDDLLVVSKVADKAHSWIHQQEQQAAASKPPPVDKKPESAGQ